ncbi:MAG TPA: hypothetical protein VGE13_03885 [Candidatus Saccharimonadales bacterium]
MNKDVIYIDVEDDITAIIGKVKASKEKVVALVPPKRVGVLQSAVNLRLLSRAAKQTDKHIALVTNNHALVALATAASIPVAKNLQTKPEMADVPALKIDDDEEDIIEGASLPIGEHASQRTRSDEKKEARSAAMAAALAEAPKSGETPKPKTKKGGPKVPNFDKFRKKLVLIIAAVILLLGFSIWAIFFAPRATVIIRAKTTSSSINVPVSIQPSAETSFEKSTIRAVSQTKSDDKKVEFQATGKKDAGKKATGTVQFSTDSISVAMAGVTIPAGSKLQSSSGLTFVTDSSVSITLSTPSGSTGVTAAENGSKYNAASGPVSGAPSGVSASLTGPTSGGVTKTITVVTAADVQKAKESLAEEDTDVIRDDLKKQFGSDTVVVDESFKVGYKGVSSSPAVGEEADSVTLEATITYSLYGVSKSEVSTFIDGYLKDELSGTDGQRVYDNGADKVTFQEASATKDGAKATLIATAQVGPEIKDEDVKNQVKGKRYGEIQESLESIQGVEDVDVKFFPFWVGTVPDDTKKITVEFNIDAK